MYSKIRISLAQSSCYRSGKVKDLKGSLSYSTEVHFFSSLPSPIAFPAYLSVILPAALQLKQIIFHGTRRSGFSWIVVTDTGKKFGPVLLMLVYEIIENNNQNVYNQPSSLFLKRKHLFAILVKKVRHVYSWHPWNSALFMGSGSWH